MANITKFEDSKKPIVRANSPFKISNDLMAFTGGTGFPVISIKGKVFHVKRGEENKLITKPGEDDDTPASSIEVVILGVSPGAGLTAKTYYAEGYSEGSNAKPTCFSNDGVAPAKDAQEPQSNKCALCPHNQPGSKPTSTNPKGRACASSKRLAVAAVDALGDPMLLRVPGASIAALGELNKLVNSRGYAYQEVVTKIGFDYSVAHPALTFKPVGVLDEATVMQVAEAVENDVTQQILDTTGDNGFSEPKAKPMGELFAEEEAKALAAPKPAAKPAPKPAAKPAPAPVADEDDLPVTPKRVTKMEEDDSSPAPKKKEAPAPKVVESDDDLDAALGSLDFD